MQIEYKNISWFDPIEQSSQGVAHSILATQLNLEGFLNLMGSKGWDAYKIDKAYQGKRLVYMKRVST